MKRVLLGLVSVTALIGYSVGLALMFSEGAYANEGTVYGHQQQSNYGMSCTDNGWGC